MQHATIVQDNEALVEAIPVLAWIVENLLSPFTYRLENLPAKCIDRDGIDERPWIRPGEHDSAFADHPPNDGRIAVVGPLERLAAVVEIPERSATPFVVPENAEREVRPLQVLRPLRFERIDARVNRLQRGDVYVRQLVAYGDDEIDIAVAVEVPDGKRALQIGADELVAQRAPDAGNQLLENRVELRVRRRMTGVLAQWRTRWR